MNSGKYNALATSLLRVKGTIKIKIPFYLLYFVSLSHKVNTYNTMPPLGVIGMQQRQLEIKYKYEPG